MSVCFSGTAVDACIYRYFRQFPCAACPDVCLPYSGSLCGTIMSNGEVRYTDVRDLNPMIQYLQGNGATKGDYVCIRQNKKGSAGSTFQIRSRSSLNNQLLGHMPIETD